MLSAIRVSLVALALLLNACASISNRQHESDPANAEALKFWTAKGKLGIRTENDATSANFVWENLDEDYRIELFGPFGQGRVEIDKRGQNVELRHKDGVRHAASAQTLLEEETGIVMPVHWLHFWILGQNVPNSTVLAAQYDEASRLSRFQQGDWLVSYERFTQIGAKSLPEKIVLTHSQYKLTIVIKSWLI